ncbi:MAG: hypothetical protein HOY71_28800 [Nonomuraea sp.]|nr:hypothetical protein [Nonomuraea sp.]
MLLLASSLIGCGPGSDDGDQVCLDRANRENALFLTAVAAVLPPGGRASVDEWNGCDSADNGATLSVLVSPELRRDQLWRAFVEEGWTPASKACAPGCAEAQLVRRMDKRLIGIAFEEAARGGGLFVTVSAADGCWDDDGYRCG